MNQINNDYLYIYTWLRYLKNEKLVCILQTPQFAAWTKSLFHTEWSLRIKWAKIHKLLLMWVPIICQSIYIYIIPNTLWGDGSIVPNLINRNGCWSLLVTAFNIVISKCPYWKYDQSNYLYPKPPPSKLGTPLHYVATPLCQPSTAILGCGTLPRLPLPQTPGRRPHHQPRNGSVTAGVFRFSMASMASNASMANCTVNVNPVSWCFMLQSSISGTMQIPNNPPAVLSLPSRQYQGTASDPFSW